MEEKRKRRTYYYARVSSKDQNLDRQLESFYALGATEDDIIKDKESGKDLNRHGYQYLKNTILHAGDTLVIKSLDRLSRNKKDITNELRFFKEIGVRVKIIDLPTTMKDRDESEEWMIEMINNLLIEVLSTMAEQERLTIKKRQAEGIAAAKAKKKHLGRPATSFPETWEGVYNSWKAKAITAKEAMKLTGLKRTSFYKLVKIWQEGPEEVEKQNKKASQKRNKEAKTENTA